MKAAYPSNWRERGLAAAAVIVVLIVVAVALVLGRGYFQWGLVLDQRGTTDANLRLVSDALVQFASLNQRLPCPASGATDTGAEDAASPYATCNSPAGTVPWAALALRRTDALDGWGRKLSYRVFAGNTGLTQLGGASMVDCNTNAAATGSVDASGKCPATHDAPPADFTAGKGLSVEGDAATTTGHAFVLVSHGETGAGAFVAEGGGRVPLPAVAAREYRNTQSGGTYDNRTRSSPGVATTDNTYFDDIVVSRSIGELATQARIASRDWGVPAGGTGGAEFTAATLAGVLGYTPDPSTNASTDQSALDFGTFAVAAVGSSGREVSFGQGMSGTGIGSIGTSLTDNQFATISSQTAEGLYFVFDDPGRYLGITLVDFGTQSGEFERVRFYFFVGGSWVQVTRTACRAGDVLANFTLNPGGDFTEVYVEARDTSGGASSQFLVGAIRSCADGFPGCTAPGALPANNCPP